MFWKRFLVLAWVVTRLSDIHFWIWSSIQVISGPNTNKSSPFCQVHQPTNRNNIFKMVDTDLDATRALVWKESSDSALEVVWLAESSMVLETLTASRSASTILNVVYVYQLMYISLLDRTDCFSLVLGLLGCVDATGIWSSTQVTSNDSLISEHKKNLFSITKPSSSWAKTAPELIWEGYKAP